MTILPARDARERLYRLYKYVCIRIPHSACMMCIFEPLSDLIVVLVGYDCQMFCCCAALSLLYSRLL